MSPISATFHPHTRAEMDRCYRHLLAHHLQCDEGTTVINGGYSGVAESIYRESIKIMQKLVYVFYIYCNIEPRTSTT